MKPITSFPVQPSLPENLKPLLEIAYNYWWVWDERGRAVFQRIDAVEWDNTRHNPVLLLQSLTQSKLKELSEDTTFVEHVNVTYKAMHDYLDSTTTWFDRSRNEETENIQVAYFCAEFGLHESFPNYSGGLGVLAGDHLKTASDLGIPLVGVGLLYQEGYFYQYLGGDGFQQEGYFQNDFYAMPIKPVFDGNGDRLKIIVEMPLGNLHAQVWKLHVGRVWLYLLDTNIPDNTIPEYRSITNQLYGGDRETRIQQEKLLGIGGYRALKAMNINPSVCHVNEGHAAFLTLERSLDLMESHSLDFYAAMEITKSGTVFTTHTPVPAGNEVFSLDLINKYFRDMYEKLHISAEQLFQLGRKNPHDSSEAFGVTILGLRTSAFRNGVSQLHGATAQEMWKEIWDTFPVHEVPIGAVTNGIHSLSWVAQGMAQLFDQYLTPEWRERTYDLELWNNVESVPNETIWEIHEHRRERLVLMAWQHIQRRLKRFLDEKINVYALNNFLHPKTFTIGFARRFATYKRGDLLFGDMERLRNLLKNPEMPVQIVIAGKAHPQDIPGKKIIQNIIQKVREYGLESHVVFLENYDMATSRFLVKGCDIWLNTPRRPMEASGTSGMKAAINGCLYVSILDGWWDEAYNGKNGFAIGTGEQYDNEQENDFVERRVLFNLLEQEIVPRFYDRSDDGVPHGWVTMMKECIRSNAGYFSSARMLKEYALDYYFPAHKYSEMLGENGGAPASEKLNWKGVMRQYWKGVRIHDVSIRNLDSAKVNSDVFVSCFVDLPTAISTNDVAVQAYFGPIGTNGEIHHGKVVELPLKKSSNNAHYFEGSFTNNQSGLQGCNVRVVPKSKYLVNTADLGLCTWFVK